ncbi:hypothetical protein TARUN_7255 [Trichoderma arundinaceum]|uniref:Uncharacterized protein n=1 Tax=Trichoderma arundinaceum TaxID=490622 RepID=A0A395NGA0_TRIAR|nr:hypothetical protein TARUN_7255 [Trichoderma arundinaceum]
MLSLPHFLRSSLEYARPPSPPRHVEEEKVEVSTKPLEDISPPVTPVAVAATDASDKTCTCARDATPVEIKPPQVTCVVEPKMEPKTEVKIESNFEPKVEQKVEPNVELNVKDAGRFSEDGEEEARDEKLPTFFSGVAVGICLLMQIFYVSLQLFLEMARSTAKWRT